MSTQIVSSLLLLRFIDKNKKGKNIDLYFRVYVVMGIGTNFSYILVKKICT